MEIDFNDPILSSKAQKDLYLLAYISGAVTTAGNLAKLTNEQSGRAFMIAGCQLFSTDSHQFAKLHLEALKSKQELSLSGLKDGVVEFRSAFGKFEFGAARSQLAIKKPRWFW